MRQQAVTVTQSGRVDGQATGKKDAKRGETAQEKLYKEELEKDGDKSSASLKGALIYRKKKSYFEMEQHARRAEEKDIIYILTESLTH